jgi:hypothetical protein
VAQEQQVILHQLVHHKVIQVEIGQVMSPHMEVVEEEGQVL